MIHQPYRGDAVEDWIKSWRENYIQGDDEWVAIDTMLDDYRLHADTGTPLDKDVTER